MKIITAENGTRSIKLSQLEWEGIGLQAGWHPDGEEFKSFIESSLKDRGLVKTAIFMVMPSSPIAPTEMDVINEISRIEAGPIGFWEMVVGFLKESAQLLGFVWGVLPFELQIALAIFFGLVMAKYGQDALNFAKPLINMMYQLAKLTGKSFIWVIKNLIQLCKATPDFLSKIYDFVANGGSDEEFDELALELTGDVKPEIEEPIVEEDANLAPAFSSLMDGNFLKC